MTHRFQDTAIPDIVNPLTIEILRYDVNEEILKPTAVEILWSDDQWDILRAWHQKLDFLPSESSRILSSLRSLWIIPCLCKNKMATAISAV